MGLSFVDHGLDHFRARTSRADVELGRSSMRCFHSNIEHGQQNVRVTRHVRRGPRRLFVRRTAPDAVKVMGTRARSPHFSHRSSFPKKLQSHDIAALSRLQSAKSSTNPAPLSSSRSRPTGPEHGCPAPASRASSERAMVRAFRLKAASANAWVRIADPGRNSDNGFDEVTLTPHELAPSRAWHGFCLGSASARSEASQTELKIF